MNDADNDFTRRSAIALGGVAALVAPTMASAGAKRSRSSYAAQEKEAEKIVTALVEGAANKDVEAVTSLMADDIEFKGAPDLPIVKGRDAMMVELGKFAALPIFERLISAKKSGRIVTMGGETGTAVLFYREDFLREKDGLRSVPIAAFLWIVKGKVKTWFDLPLAPDPDGTNWGA